MPDGSSRTPVMMRYMESSAPVRERWLARQRVAGRVVRGTVALLGFPPEPEGDHDLRRHGVHVDDKLTELRERLLLQRQEATQ